METTSDRPTPASAGSESAPSRRGFFLAAAALALGARSAEGQERTRVRRPTVRRQESLRSAAAMQAVPEHLASIGTPPPLQQTVWRDPVARLVRRITMGITEEELERARGMGYRAYLDEQLAASRIDDRECAAFVQRTFPVLTMRPDELATSSQATTQLQEAALYRAAFSRRQLQERMVEFWTDHFNIFRDDVGFLKVIDDRDVIRRHALGRFPALLRASAHSPAMMEYLDQTRSRRGQPNENYAREIMELHSLGVDGGYTQQDVAQLARVFTGWTTIGRGSFYYDARIHDFGVKKVLGRVIPSTAEKGGLAGKDEAERVIDFLALHPNTARYISFKLARFFLSYDPPDAVVQAAADAFLRSRGDIPSVLRVILAEENLRAAPPMYKRPFHLAVSAARVLRPTVTSVGVMRSNVDVMGQSLYAWPTPDGYPVEMEFWSGLVMQRWNTANAFANASATSTSFAVDPASFQGGTVDETVDNIVQRCFGGEVTAGFRSRLADYLRPDPASTTRLREAVSLALSSSQFQWF